MHIGIVYDGEWVGGIGDRIIIKEWQDGSRNEGACGDNKIHEEANLSIFIAKFTRENGWMIRQIDKKYMIIKMERSMKVDGVIIFKKYKANKVKKWLSG